MNKNLLILDDENRIEIKDNKIVKTKMCAILEIDDYNKIEIYKIKDWSIYFKYEGIHFMIRHISDCGDHWNELTNKDNWMTKQSDYSLFDIRDFLKLKFGKGYVRHSTPYKHLDLEYFVECLVKLKLAKIK
jgi:hypothetical protein